MRKRLLISIGILASIGFLAGLIGMAVYHSPTSNPMARVKYINYGAYSTYRRSYPAHMAAYRDEEPKLAAMINNGTNGTHVDMHDKHENTLLQVAVNGLALNSTKVLLEAGADITAGWDVGRNGKRSSSLGPPIEVATCTPGPRESFVTDSETGARLTDADEETNRLEIIRLLSADGQVYGRALNCAVYLAVRTGSRAVYEHLISLGLDLNDEQGSGARMLWSAGMNRHLEVVQFLLGEGVNPNATDPKSGDTALHGVAFGYRPDVEIAKLLLAHGANPELRNDKGELPLDVVRSGFQNQEAIEFGNLLEMHADN